MVKIGGQVVSRQIGGRLVGGLMQIEVIQQRSSLQRSGISLADWRQVSLKVKEVQRVGWWDKTGRWCKVCR